jgi:hypothetical protein
MLNLNKWEPLPDFSGINKKSHKHDDQTDHLLLRHNIWSVKSLYKILTINLNV